ncbi:hypothetical protein HA466_0295570 [Hirschfeldia incana]|nr:hypothetical protein HA466_0295570 [Hirschfeldia incana]
MATATSTVGRDPLFLSPSSSPKSVRAAAIKIRFADIIVKSSHNKSDAVMKIRKEKQLLQRKQLQEKARIEARMKLRQEARLAVMKVEEEEEANLRDDKLFFSDHHVSVHVTSDQEFIYVFIKANVDTGRQVRAAVKKKDVEMGFN